MIHIRGMDEAAGAGLFKRVGSVEPNISAYEMPTAGEVRWLDGICSQISFMPHTSLGHKVYPGSGHDHDCALCDRTPPSRNWWDQMRTKPADGYHDAMCPTSSYVRARKCCDIFFFIRVSKLVDDYFQLTLTSDFGAGRTYRCDGLEGVKAAVADLGPILGLMAAYEQRSEDMKKIESELSRIKRNLRRLDVVQPANESAYASKLKKLKQEMNDIKWDKFYLERIGKAQRGV
jgi:hypothetical protein